MKVTTTLDLISKSNLTSNLTSELLERFNAAYQNIDPSQEVDLRDMINNGHNTLEDVILVLCVASKQEDAHLVYEQMLERYNERFNNFCKNSKDRSYVLMEEEYQKQDLIELLS